MNEFIQILQVVLTWPTAFILAMFILYRPITLVLKRIVDSNTAKAKLGFVELEIGELARKGKLAVDNFNELSITMAKTRLLELDVTKENFVHNFSSQQQVKLNTLMIELERKISQLEEGENENLSAKK
ncbi:hypothetical protein [Klebsiella aerogenes]|uniref:hypothetical protein n=1 Tax=Klebsiella TaxID=570 RepID=UPI001BD4F1F9|nr:hypothetical protein [Klebsiella aerogenes]HDS2184585.1 hypothetical protein [Klebsiella aerogenes]HDT0435740.1 hypothetical protein [Klebsiella aerogenes]HDT4320119.1 hypothetical protein [Klebsiella aerogenes]HDT4798928.1 hypothetical protein [Klebsiella aerogenes]HDU4048503.1 hypothetical protein [Klebsiella aerogenes]